MGHYFEHAGSGFLNDLEFEEQLVNFNSEESTE